MENIQRLLLENKAWAERKIDGDKDFFASMALSQSPDYLWIGCADSRVHPAEMTNTSPGKMFVHRNIANLVVHSDMNLLSVLSYAVENLNVPHIIICGHYNCGGVKAALSKQDLGMINNWIRNIKDVYFKHHDDIEKYSSDGDKVNRLVELSVIEQVKNVAHTSIVQRSWHGKKGPTIHGLVYDINNGILKELIQMDSGSKLDPSYKYEF